MRLLKVIRVAGFTVFVLEVLFGIFTVYSIRLTSDVLLTFCVCSCVVGVICYLMPRLFFRVVCGAKHVVSGSGNAWSIGQYDEEQLRMLVYSCHELSGKRREVPRVLVADERGANGFTILSLLGFSGREKRIWISAGALHYLEPDEVKALILHESAHHEREFRIGVPGGWVLSDCLFLIWFSGTSSFISTILVLFMFYRLGVGFLVSRIQRGTSQQIEHGCDQYAASLLGVEPVVNMLLKVGEEVELSEAILARAAKRLLHDVSIDFEDLVPALNQVRPYGRIFHENLFIHADEIVKTLSSGKALKRKGVKKVNQEFAEFLERRKGAKQRRVRWRSFDRDGAGMLNKSEIDSLTAFMQKHSDRCLFFSSAEYAPEEHPGFRGRILYLNPL